MKRLDAHIVVVGSAVLALVACGGESTSIDLPPATLLRFVECPSTGAGGFAALGDAMAGAIDDCNLQQIRDDGPSHDAERAAIQVAQRLERHAVRIAEVAREGDAPAPSAAQVGRPPEEWSSTCGTTGFMSGTGDDAAAVLPGCIGWGLRGFESGLADLALACETGCATIPALDPAELCSGVPSTTCGWGVRQAELCVGAMSPAERDAIFGSRNVLLGLSTWIDVYEEASLGGGA